MTKKSLIAFPWLRNFLGLIKQFANYINNKVKNSPNLKKVLVPLLAAWIAYLLSLVPVSQALEQCELCSTIKTNGNQSVKIINLDAEPDTPLFEYIAQPNQAITVHFDRARLSENLSGLFPEKPNSPQAISFKALKNEKSKIFIRVLLKKTVTTQNALYISRDLSTRRTQPDIKLQVEGIELALEIAQVSDPESPANSDQSELVIGETYTKIKDLQLQIIPEQNTSVAFRFNLAGWNPKESFDDFSISNKNHENKGEIYATGIHTATLSEGKQQVINLLCAAPGKDQILWFGNKQFRNGACNINPKKLTPLKLTDFKITQDGVQLSTHGYAWAKINGKLNYSVLDYLQEIKQWYEKIKAIFEL